MYKIYPIEWEARFNNEIELVYKMFKDQEHRIFDLSAYDNYGSVMDIVEDTITNDTVFVVVNSDGYLVASFILEDAILYQDIILEVKLHCAIRRPFWGSVSRDICRAMKQYLDDNYTIKKLIAEVPQCKYGIIKLLKDIGFKHEGTLKECTIYKDKNNNPKFYDKLIYTSTREDIKL